MTVFDLQAVLGLDSSEYDTKLKIAEGSASKMGGKISGGFAKIGKAAKVAMVAAGAAVAGFGVSSVKTAMNFESSMSQVAATMGYSVEELHTAGSEAQKTYQTLSNFAQQMGATTKFSATESAEALNYMALAGYDAETSMAMLPNVLNLAAAGGMELAEASDMVTDTQSALGLTTAETTELVDKMAKASSKANTSVAQLGSAMLTIGGTAKSLAGGTTELSAALGILADNGIKGAEGGTALRNVLLSFSNGKFDKAFSDLGVEAYDATGELRPLKDIVGDMRETMNGWSQEAKDAKISEAFNARDLKTINALLGTTDERWDELTASINDSKGAAEEMAKTQLDNLAGQVTLLKSAFEGVQIAIGGKLSPALQKIAGGFTNMFSDLSSAINTGGFAKVFTVLASHASMAVSSIVKSVGNIAQGIAANGGQMISSVLSLATTMSAGLRANAGKLVDAGINLAKSIAKGIVDGMPAMIQNIPTIVSNIAGIINDNVPKLLSAGLNIVATLAKGIVSNIPTLIANFPKILKSIWDVFMAFNWMSLGSKLITGIREGIKAVGNNLPTVLKTIFSKARDTIINIKWSGVGKTLIESLMMGLRTLTTKFVPWLKNELSTGIDAAKAVDWAGVGIAAITMIGKGLASAGGFIMDALGSAIGKAAEALDSIDWSAVGNKIIEGLMAGVDFLFVTIPEKLSEIGSTIIEVFSSIDWMAVGSTIINFIVTGITSFGSFIGTALQAIGSSALSLFQSINWSGVGSSVISFIVNGISGLGSLVGSVLSSIATTGASLFRSIPWSSVGSAVINFISSGIRGLGSLVSSALRAIGTAAMNAFKSINWGSVGKAVVQGIARGITGGAKLVVDAAKNLAKKAFEGAKNFLGIESPSKLFRDEVGKRISEGIGVGILSAVPIEQTELAMKKLLSAASETLDDGYGEDDELFDNYELIGEISKGDVVGRDGRQAGDIVINVYATEKQDEREIANIVADKLGEMYRRRKLIYA